VNKYNYELNSQS
jgi:hypothetical protein